MEYAMLNNGVKMPMAGIGTFLLSPDEAEASVLSALQCGYRLIDTANAYVNEKAVGRAMKRSGLNREEIFLETKLWPSFYEQDDAVDKTLARLDTDYIDLLLIHQPAGNYIAGYRQMEKAYKEGKVRAIGLSNFNEAQIREILEICEVKPSVLQSEVHPYSQEQALKQFLAQEGMVIQAWYPLGHGDKALINEPLFTELAQKYESAANTVDNITNDDGQIDGDAIDGIYSSQIYDLEDAIISSTTILDLTTQYLQVSGKLTAVEADVGTLNTNVADINQALIKKLDAEEANILYAKIKDMDVVHASISVLETESANLKTLLSGNAGVGDLQNIHLTSANASFSPPFKSASNLLLGPRSSVSSRDNCIAVQLPSGDVRDALNLSSNPEMLGRLVCLKGDIESSYYGLVGLKNVSDFVLK